MDRIPYSVYSSYMFLWSFVLTFDIGCESSSIHYFYVEIVDSVYVVLFFKSHIGLWNHVVEFISLSHLVVLFV
jgi:hypothetical protein